MAKELGIAAVILSLLSIGKWGKAEIARGLGIMSMAVVITTFFVPHGWLLAFSIAFPLVVVASIMGDTIFATITLIALVPHTFKFLQLFFLN